MKPIFAEHARQTNALMYIYLLKLKHYLSSSYRKYTFYLIITARNILIPFNLIKDSEGIRLVRQIA